MKKSRDKVMVTVTLGDVLDAPLMDSWNQMCLKYNINEWCINEGLSDRDDTIEVSLEDAEYWGLIEDKNI